MTIEVKNEPHITVGIMDGQSRVEGRLNGTFRWTASGPDEPVDGRVFGERERRIGSSSAMAPAGWRPVPPPQDRKRRQNRPSISSR